MNLSEARKNKSGCLKSTKKNKKIRENKAYKQDGKRKERIK